MKYSGIIVGLLPSSKSIYNDLPEENCYLWKSKVVAEFIEDKLNIRFNWYDEGYDLMLDKLKENYYVGDIQMNQEKIGRCFFWIYTNGTNLLLKGDYKRNDSENFECFLDLRPII